SASWSRIARRGGRVIPQIQAGKVMCRNIETVAPAYFSVASSMGANDLQTVQLAMKRGAADAQKPGGSRNIPLGARKSPQNNAPLRFRHIFTRVGMPAKKVGGR